jgi:hypothetical protein
MAKQKVKILVYTAMYNRPKVSALFATAIKRFIAEAPKNVKVEVYATVSEPDSQIVCINNGFHYAKHPNKPLGRKWNAGMLFCLQKLNFDYALIMGDDDIISSNAWPIIMEQIEHGNPYFGFQSIYFVNSEKPQAARFTYRGKSDNDKLIGCGRFISKEALLAAGLKHEVKFIADFNHGLITAKEGDTLLVYSRYAEYLVKCGHAVYTATAETFALWRDNQDTGLDHESETNLIHAGYFPYAIHTPKPLMADIKSSQNIWAYETRASRGVRAPYAEAIGILTPTEQKQLKALAKA